MSREIKFRVMTTAGEWKVYTLGDLACGDAVTHEELQLKLETWRQYIGLKDESGVEIYEGSIVQVTQFLFDGTEIEEEWLGVIGSNFLGWTLEKIRNRRFEQHTGYASGEGSINLSDMCNIEGGSFTVIGNIHENPELLNAD